MDHTELGNYAWELLQKGDAKSAAEIYGRLVQDAPNVGDWNNFGNSLMMSGKLSDAETAFRRVRTSQSPHGFVSLDVGSALWLQGKYTDACNDWHEELDRIMSTKLKRYNAAGIFISALLWWAYRKLDLPEQWNGMQPQLKLVLKTRGQQEEWGMAIMGFIMGKIDIEQLVFHAIGGDQFVADFTDRWTLRRLSQAHFYIAGKYEVGSREWRHNLELTVTRGTPAALDMPERNIAKYELERS